MEHLDYITAPVDMLMFGVKDEYKQWWNFDRMLQTWEILDAHPDAPLKELPLYHHGIDVWKLKGGPFETVLRCVKAYRRIYFDIRDNGYDYEKASKPIRIRIRKNGELAIGNGHHRVSMLKHLKYPEIDIEIASRHPSFTEFKDKLYNLYGGKLLYQPVDHPDFSDWVIVQNGYEEVFQLMKDNIDIKDKHILDIGCCTGDFSYRLAELGGRLVGIDTNKKRIEIAEYQRGYREAEQENPVFKVESFETHLEKPRRYDMILLLNVIHHYLRRDVEKAYSRLIDISKKTDILVIQLDTKIPVTIQELVDKVMIITDFKEYIIYYIPKHLNRPVIIFKKEKEK